MAYIGLYLAFWVTEQGQWKSECV